MGWEELGGLWGILGRFKEIRGEMRGTNPGAGEGGGRRGRV